MADTKVDAWLCWMIRQHFNLRGETRVTDVSWTMGQRSWAKNQNLHHWLPKEQHWFGKISSPLQISYVCFLRRFFFGGGRLIFPFRKYTHIHTLIHTNTHTHLLAIGSRGFIQVIRNERIQMAKAKLRFAWINNIIAVPAYSILTSWACFQND